MKSFLVRRAILAVVVLFTVSLISFGLLKLSGDLAVSLTGEQGAEYTAFLRKEYGLDQPLVIQYGRWLVRTLSGDLGTSYYFSQPVSSLIFQKLPVTMTLGLTALVLALVTAIPMGIVAALLRDTLLDRLVLSIVLVGQAMPTFWLCFLMMSIFGVELGWLPISGSGSFAHIIMPSIALSLYAIPAFTRITRTGMIEVMQSDYVRTARAKGLRPHAIILQHALSNTLVPLSSMTAVQLGFMLGGSVVIETVFALDGIGYLAWQSISQNDYPIVEAIVLLMAAIYVTLTLGADLLNAFLDPRIRVS